MSLTTGRGPFSAQPAGRLLSPGGYVEPFLRRVRGLRGSETVIDSERVLLVHEPGHPPRYAFPRDDVRIVAAPEPTAAGYVFVAWDAVSAWFEEEEQVFGHPRNPYHRIDCVRARRQLRVRVAEVLLVDTYDVIALHETSRPPQLYVDKKHVDMTQLVASETVSFCPYKGRASYWSTSATRDVAWSYEEPTPESAPIAGMLSFYSERVQVEQDVPTWFPCPPPPNPSTRV
jgi:uncharacterized protein (DUF427 family)